MLPENVDFVDKAVRGERGRCAALAMAYLRLRLPENIVPRFDILFERDPSDGLLKTVPAVGLRDDRPLSREECVAEARGATDLMRDERERCAAIVEACAAQIRGRR